jgi:hypothetical protein
MEVVRSSEISVNIYQTRQRQIPEDSISVSNAIMLSNFMCILFRSIHTVSISPGRP